MRSFEYFEPASIEEACDLLQRYGEDARPLAGGTALIIWMRQRLLNPKVLVSLARIPGFENIRFDPKRGLLIGAGARHRDVELDASVRQHYPLLHETFRKVAQPRIRNMATVGGNLCQGDPLTDPGASLLALDASVTLQSANGKRSLALEAFFIDYYETALRSGELLTEVHVPPPAPGLSWAHIKFTPRSVEDFATVGVAVAMQHEGEICKDIRVALNAAGPKIFRARKAERTLRGEKITATSIREMAEIAASESDPIEDNRGSAEYKREMVKVMVRRAAAQALGRL
ncbi:MAG TPA: xanthine dehydrogenase family protein subunit M [Candidatus Acidoferrales bacterium]|nr:xanthine dehydrogenase family protein subunit M [Candidatus Acidoferrales bacterium]